MGDYKMRRTASPCRVPKY